MRDGQWLYWMRRHRTVSLSLLGGMAAIIVLVTTLAVVVPKLRTFFGAQRPLQTAQPKPIVPATPLTIPQENALPGTTAWMLDKGADTIFIQGYAGSAAITAGESVSIYVSSAQAATYSLDVYRLGWYGGLGGHLYYSQKGLHSLAQGVWDITHGLTGCTTCIIDPKTKLLDANWQLSLTLTTGPTWTSGVYLIKLTSTQPTGLAESYIPLVVRAEIPQSPILAEVPVMTYQAYNYWGGYSLYQKAGKAALGGEETGNRAVKVGFNRPYERDAGAGDLLNWDIHTIRWLERNGFQVDYETGLDFAAHPETLLQYHVLIALGHDEYWTKSMRDGAENARDQGVNLAFFGANDAYWQARLEPDSAGNPARTLVCYKVATGTTTADMKLTDDPYYPADPAELTAQWRDPVINRPENELLGLMYSSYFLAAQNGKLNRPDWVVKTGPADPMLAGTGLTPGEHIKGGLLGYEYDSVANNKHGPADLHVLALSPVQDVYKEVQMAATAYYRAASGALVFDAGSIWWSYGLDELYVPGQSQPNLLRGNKQIMALSKNILLAMLPANLQPDSTPTTPGTVSATAGPAQSATQTAGAPGSVTATPGARSNPITTPGARVNPTATPGAQVNPTATPGVQDNPTATPGSNN